MTALKWLFALLIAAATAASFWAPPAKNFSDPELARIIFFHLPCAISTPLFLFFGSWLSFKYLRTRDMAWDVRAAAANEMGFILAVLTMVTGIMFSKFEWGAWWNWDPRQTSFLLVLLLYGAYFALRAAFSDERRAAANSGAYSVAAVIPAIFLIFVFPRLPQVVTLHPLTTITNRELDATYSTVLSTLFILILVLCVWVYRLNVRAGLISLQVQERHGNLEADRGHPANTGVVRPISLSDESRA